MSLNPIDINVGAGRYFGGHPEFPYVPGCEGVGRAPDGMRVYLFGDGLGLSRDGLLAERAAAPGRPRHPASGCGFRRDRGGLRHRRDGRLDARRVARARAAATTACSCSARPARSGSSPCRRRSSSAPGASSRPAAIRERLARAAELGADATVSLDEDDLVGAFKEAAGGDGPTHIVDALWGPPAVAAIAGRRTRLAPRPGRPVRGRRGVGSVGGDPRQDGRDLRLHRLRGAAGTCSASTTCASSAMRPRARSSSTSRPIRWSGSPRPGSGRPPAPRPRSSSRWPAATAAARPRTPRR